MSYPIATSTIAAQAFRFMEMRSISSFGDGSQQATSAAEQYPEAMNFVLASYDWGFARKMVTLPATVTLPADVVVDPDLPGTFVLLADFLTLRRVYPSGIAYRLDQGVLRADQLTPLSIAYTARQTNEAIMPPAFKLAVALQLAIRLAPEWVSARTKRNDLLAQYAEAIRLAIQADHLTASPARIDGRSDQNDWSQEAVL